MATYDVTIKKHNGSDWDTIYPKTKAENIISGVLDAARIPSLDASKINAGTLGVDRIPNLNASKINAGVLDVARIPSLDASKIASGVLDAARLPAIALTNVMVSTTLASFITIYADDPTSAQEGDVLILTTDKQTYIHNGGTTGTASDFTLLQTPDDVVTSVAGKTGAVSLVKGDVGLGNVDNTSDANKPVSTAQAAAIALKVTANTAITGATKTKITYDSKGLVTGGADLAEGDIPSLPASKIGSGTLADARIPALAISKITGLQGALDIKQRLITYIASGSIPTPDTGPWSDGDIIFHNV